MIWAAVAQPRPPRETSRLHWRHLDPLGGSPGRRSAVLGIIGGSNSTMLTDKHNHTTRLALSKNYYMPQPRTKLGLSSLKYLGPKIWQSVPTEIKDKSFDTFKSKFKKHLIQSYNVD